MANKRENTRLALEAEGATAEEIAEALAEIEAEEDGRDPNARARRSGVPPLYLGANFDGLDLDEDDRNTAIMAARNWAVFVAGVDPDDELSKKRGRLPAKMTRPRGGAPSGSSATLLERLAFGDLSGTIPKGLYLWSAEGDEDESGFGTGKTRIAAAVVQHVLRAGTLRVRWIDVVRSMTDLNLPFSHPVYAKAATRLGAPARGELVVLDDIDKQPPTDRNVQPIFALVNDCVNGEVPLLITANRSIDDLLEDWGDRFGVAVASRIIGHCLDVEVRGRDRRLDPVVSS